MSVRLLAWKWNRRAEICLRAFNVLEWTGITKHTTLRTLTLYGRPRLAPSIALQRQPARGARNQQNGNHKGTIEVIRRFDPRRCAIKEPKTRQLKGKTARLVSLSKKSIYYAKHGVACVSKTRLRNNIDCLNSRPLCKNKASVVCTTTDKTQLNHATNAPHDKKGTKSSNNQSYTMSPNS